MDRGELLDLHVRLCFEAKHLMESKGHDYAPDGADPFKNFRLCNAVGLCDTLTGVAVRLGDKYSRLITAITKDELKVKDEGVLDTILDAINYNILIYALYQERTEAIVKADREEEDREEEEESLEVVQGYLSPGETCNHPERCIEFVWRTKDNHSIVCRNCGIEVEVATAWIESINPRWIQGVGREKLVEHFNRRSQEIQNGRSE